MEKKETRKKTMTEEHQNILKGFITWLTLKGYKPRGIEEKERAVKQYLEYAGTHSIAIERAGLHEAEAFREYLRLLINEKGVTRYNPKTINGKITYLRLFYHYLTAIDRAYRNPFLDIDKMKESETVPKNILSIDEMETLLNNILVDSPEDFTFKVVIELLYASGARISELENLKRDDVYPDAGYIIIRDDKARQERNAPLTEYSASLLCLYVKQVSTREHTYIFQHGKKRSLNRWVNSRLKRLTKELELPPLSCHGIRHTIATHLLKKGADLREVQEILGHKRIRNTEVYTRIFPEDLKEVIEKTHPREQGVRNEANTRHDTPSL